MYLFISMSPIYDKHSITQYVCFLYLHNISLEVLIVKDKYNRTYQVKRDDGVPTGMTHLRSCISTWNLGSSGTCTYKVPAFHLLSSSYLPSSFPALKHALCTNSQPSKHVLRTHKQRSMQITLTLLRHFSLIPHHHSNLIPYSRTQAIFRQRAFVFQ